MPAKSYGTLILNGTHSAAESLNNKLSLSLQYIVYSIKILNSSLNQLLKFSYSFV